VLVHRATMSIIDGAHRLLAAKLRGQDEIDARLLEGDRASCFVMAVRANVTHGLPLSLADRKAAAADIIRLYPNWSDRMIASVSGLAAGTVAGLRSRPNAENSQLDGRIGRDGRARPLNPAERRQAAADIITEHPEASLREIAEQAGISPETARKVRLQLRNGEAKPMGPQLREVTQPSDLNQLRRDPALRSRQQGRLLLRMLSAVEVLDDHAGAILRDVPVHELKRVAEAARACSRAWQKFADEADREDIGPCEADQARDSA
jgi:ParB-like chromosome segregation protein Spo0J